MSAVRPISVAIVEDHALTRAGLRTALEGAGYTIAGEAADGNAGEALIRATHPTVAVLDLGLPGKDGIAVATEIKRAGAPTRVVVLTMQEREDDVIAALSAGADAYCVKSSDPSVVVQAIAIVAAGGAFFDARIANLVLRRFGPDDRPASPSPLTGRELQILQRIANGRSNAEIAADLHIGLGTVKGHIRDILERLAAADRTHAAVTALRHGWI